MNAQVINVQLDPVDAALEVGLKDLWFPVCPSGFVKDNPVSLRRLGYKLCCGAMPPAKFMRSKTTAHTVGHRCRWG